MYAIANLGSPSHWMILIIVCLVIFGAKHLPDIARNLGKGLGEFKKARKQFEDELMKEENNTESKKIASEEKPATSTTEVPATSTTEVPASTEKKREERIDV